MQFDRLVHLQKEAQRYRRREEYLRLQEGHARERVLKEQQKLQDALLRKRHKVKRELKIMEQKVERSFLRKKEALRQN